MDIHTILEHGQVIIFAILQHVCNIGTFVELLHQVECPHYLRYPELQLLIPNAVLLLSLLNPPANVKIMSDQVRLTDHHQPVLNPDLLSPLHAEAEGGAPVPVLGGGHDEPVAGDVRADAAVGEPAAAHPVAEHNQRPAAIRRQRGLLQNWTVNSTVEDLPDMSTAQVHQRSDVGDLVYEHKLSPWSPAGPSGQNSL